MATAARGRDTDPVDWLDEPERSRPSPLRARWLLLGAGVATLVLVVVGTAGRNGPTPVPGPAPTSHRVLPPRPSPTPSELITWEFLGAFETDATWELFVRTNTELIRVQPASSRVTHTPLPELITMDPVSLVVEPGEVIIRPVDAVPGYEVPDDRLPRVGAGAVAMPGPVFPGPAAGQLWVPEEAAPRMVLVRLDGTPVGVSAALDPDAGVPEPDGAGGVLVPRARGTFDVGPDRDFLVTDGRVIAVGGGRLLARECGRSGCRFVVADVRGHRRVLAGVPARLLGDGWTGVISPDGRRAALADPSTGQVHILDLVTGADLPTAASANLLLTTSGGMAWLPDNARLVIIESGRTLALVDAVSGGRTDFWLELPPALQIAVRSR